MLLVNILICPSKIAWFVSGKSVVLFIARIRFLRVVKYSFVDLSLTLS